jgi:hypothetical protein
MYSLFSYAISIATAAPMEVCLGILRSKISIEDVGFEVLTAGNSALHRERLYAPL